MQQTSTYARDRAQRVAANPNTFLGRMNRMRLNVTSKDGTVKAIYTIHDGTRVSFDERRLASHDEKSLAMAIVEVVKGVNKGYAQGTAEVYRRVDGTTRWSQLRGTEVGNRRERYHEMIAGIEVSVTSPRGYVKVRSRERGDIELKIRPGTLGRVDVNAATLAAEVNAALDAVSAQLARHKRHAHEQVFGYQG